jgi:hypothetical protein
LSMRAIFVCGTPSGHSLARARARALPTPPFSLSRARARSLVCVRALSRVCVCACVRALSLARAHVRCSLSLSHLFRVCAHARSLVPLPPSLPPSLLPSLPLSALSPLSRARALRKRERYLQCRQMQRVREYYYVTIGTVVI